MIWDDGNQNRCWYLGFFVSDCDENSIKIDHLKMKKGNRERWIRGQSDDIQVADLTQVLPIKVIGDWDFGECQTTFVIQNEDEISDIFKQYCWKHYINVSTCRREAISYTICYITRVIAFKLDEVKPYGIFAHRREAIPYTICDIVRGIEFTPDGVKPYNTLTYRIDAVQYTRR